MAGWTISKAADGVEGMLLATGGGMAMKRSGTRSGSKGATGKKGRELFHPLRAALTGRESVEVAKQEMEP